MKRQLLTVVVFVAVAATLSGPSTSLRAARAPVEGGQAGQERGGAARLPSTANGEWPHYTADLRGSRYSPLDQINGSNFNTLEVAWRFKTDMFGPRPEYK